MSRVCFVIENMGSPTKDIDFDAATKFNNLTQVGQTNQTDLISELEFNYTKYFQQLEPSTITEHREDALTVRKQADHISLTEDDALAARLYTCETPRIYWVVNDLLRKLSGEPAIAEKSQQDLKDWAKFVYYLSQAISKLNGTSELSVLYRGQTYVPPDIEQWKVGELKVWPAFTSCSTDRSASESFANGNIMFEITIKPNYGGFLTPYSVFPNESELLLPSFSSFEVKKITKGGPKEKWVVELELQGNLALLNAPFQESVEVVT